MADTGPDKLWTLSPAIDLGKKTLIPARGFWCRNSDVGLERRHSNIDKADPVA